MKKQANSFYLIILIGLYSCSEASNKQAEFYVRGNCEMCKERIENVATAIPGVKSAEWDVNTQNLKIAFDSTKTTELAVHQAEASFGHGTELVVMDSLAHDKLPDCCKAGME